MSVAVNSWLVPLRGLHLSSSFTFMTHYVVLCGTLFRPLNFLVERCWRQNRSFCSTIVWPTGNAISCSPQACSHNIAPSSFYHRLLEASEPHHLHNPPPLHHDLPPLLRIPLPLLWTVEDIGNVYHPDLQLTRGRRGCG